MSTQYLYQRRRGGSWYVKTQGAKRVEVSLRTTDRAQAEVLALPYIQAHKNERLQARMQLVTTWTRRYEPRLTAYAGDDGEQIIAGPHELTIYDAAGTFLRTEPNGRASRQLVGNGYLSARDEFAIIDAAEAGKLPDGPIDRPTLPTRQGDDAILDDYLTFKGRQGQPRREAENTWAVFRQLTRGKPLHKCTWDDGRALAVHLQTSRGLKSASVKRYLVPLNAAVNHAVKRTGKLPRTFLNPFAAVVANVGDDATRKVGLDDADLKACRDNLHKLSAPDRLLFRILCTTGMRLGEGLSIASEKTLKGIRLCEVGTKTEASWRRVPFPEHLLPHLPAVIDGPLFVKRDANAASKRLNTWLREHCGIVDPAKTVHSLRHRAIELLREAECPDHISRRLFGHAKDEHENYGDAITILKKWADRIDGI